MEALLASIRAETERLRMQVEDEVSRHMKTLEKLKKEKKDRDWEREQLKKMQRAFKRISAKKHKPVPEKENSGPRTTKNARQEQPENDRPQPQPREIIFISNDDRERSSHELNEQRKRPAGTIPYDDDKNMSAPLPTSHRPLKRSRMSVLQGTTTRYQHQPHRHNEGMPSRQEPVPVPRPPASNEPPYPYVNEPVRGRCERKKLPGHTCAQCEAFYADAAKNLSEHDRRNLMDCSRHRSKFKRPDTPPGFWDLEFADSVQSPHNKSPSF